MDIVWAPWAILAAYCGITLAANPRRATPLQFFRGLGRGGEVPSIWLVAASAAITWIFAKSIANASDLGKAFGPIGGLGYGAYYLSFPVAAVAIYFLRTRGGHSSLSGFLVSKYGPTCARLFLLAIAIRLFNEVWSNTKVAALYFGAEGSSPYWIAALLITAFTLWYAWTGGMRASLLTDNAQMILAAILLAVVMVAVMPPLVRHGVPAVDAATRWGGLTFCALALVQVLSYPFHDPVLTDRAFINEPRRMVRAFLLGGAMAGGFILLFSGVGVYARAFGIEGSASIGVPASLGLAMMLVFNGIMLTSAGSTIDSTFTSVGKWAAQDWQNDHDAVTPRQVGMGRRAMLVIAILGNLPLLAIYLPGGSGPAIIAATTISGTMVMASRRSSCWPSSVRQGRSASILPSGRGWRSVFSAPSRGRPEPRSFRNGLPWEPASMRSTSA